MKRGITAALLLCVLTSVTAFAQETAADTSSDGSLGAYKPNAFTVSVGAGWGLSRTFGNLLVPPIYASFEYNWMPADNIPMSIGLSIGYSLSKETYRLGGSDNILNYHYLLLGLRAAYHFSAIIPIKQLDFYAGVFFGGGWIIATVDGPDAAYLNADKDIFTPGGFAGVRYFFTPAISIYAEGGYGPAYVQGGVLFQL